MKAVVLHEYGGPEKLKTEAWDDPVAGPGEVLVRVAATSVNPIDFKQRSGAVKDRMPIEFPAILGRDVAGVVRAVGDGVTDFAPGDHVFALTHKAYAELCVVEAAELAKLPEGMDVAEAGRLPLVLITGMQLVQMGTGIGAGQTVLVTGAAGSVGRVAVRTAKMAGARVIAGVKKSQLAEGAKLGADSVLALDDEEAMDGLGFVDAIADTVGGKTAAGLLKKIRQGGVFATVATLPEGAAALNPTLTTKRVQAAPDPAGMVRMAEEVKAGRLVLPIDRMLPLAEAGAGQRAAEKGGVGKILLLA